MSTAARPRRSVLYMPGSNARALEKGRSLPADALILDLEDAVAPDAKAVARQQIVEAIAAGGYGARELIVRVNGFDSPWGDDDVKAMATSGADAILLPKVETAAMVRDLEARMVAAGAPDGMGIDATTGQNAVGQAQAFMDIAGVTGIIMTKLDGTARGGILVAIAEKFALPIHAIGVGESVDDLQPFDAYEFAALIAGAEEKVEA